MNNKKPPVIYRNFNHWFSRSPAHGMSSASRDWMKEIWDDIYPTIEANLDDHKRAYIALMEETARNNTELVGALLDYIKEHRREGDPLFWRWWCDQAIKEDKKE